MFLSWFQVGSVCGADSSCCPCVSHHGSSHTHAHTHLFITPHPSTHSHTLVFFFQLALTILRLYGRIQLALPPVSQFTQDGVSEMMGTLDPVSESYIPPLCTTEDDMEAGNETRERKRRNKPMSMNEAVAHAEASASAAPLTALPWDAEDVDAQSYQRSDDARSHANVSTMYGSMTGESLDGVSTRAMIAPPSFQSSEQSSNDV